MLPPDSPLVPTAQTLHTVRMEQVVAESVLGVEVWVRGEGPYEEKILVCVCVCVCV